MKCLLLSLAKSLGVVFILAVVVPLPFLILGYNEVSVSLFSTCLLLFWTDAFLTYFVLNRNMVAECNPIISFLNKFCGIKKGLLLSRLLGSALLVYGLILERSPYWLLAVTWILAILLCTNSVTLILSLSHFLDDPISKNAKEPKIISHSPSGIYDPKVMLIIQTIPITTSKTQTARKTVKISSQSTNFELKPLYFCFV